MLAFRWPVLLLAASPVVLAHTHIPRAIHARQDDSLLSQIWTSLEIIASNAISCPASCAGWLLSSAECGFEIAATLSLDATISCLCEDVGDDLRDCATCVAADSSSSAEAKSAAAGVADLFDQGCGVVGHTRSSSAVAASKTTKNSLSSTPGPSVTQPAMTAPVTIQTALPNEAIILGTDSNGFTYLSTISYSISYDTPLQVQSIISQASASSVSVASAYNSSLAAALASSIAASYARAAASYTVSTTVQGQQTVTVFTAAGPANTGASAATSDQSSGGKGVAGWHTSWTGALAGVAAVLYLL
ncbi:hypothetical protein RTBOTA2_005107 [Rhodotorula toruloides]|uniref:Proteophosphoglycan ppg4 n=1 Tax=Rhodotorula toruloides TaxID=5286 RepID=A0A0K3CEQ9_RHOTO|nr:hypothetical protein RTBOTA2_005107 [Rhodotorula toruloides]PRQ74352.1 hypothetical protein AAT19DRAFT_14705 [Rhodotorula toruloides]